MADVKVPALLHKMSKAAQKAWYKKNNMAMPDDAGGRSAAAAKRVKVAPRKEIAVEPNSVRALNAARQKAYMAKGGRQPIGAAGSGGHSSMAGSNMSTAKGIVAGIKAGYNPKVSLDPYESEKAKKVGPRSLKLKKESVDEASRIDLIKRAAASNRMGKSTFLSKVNARAAQLAQQKRDDKVTKSKVNFGMSNEPVPYVNEEVQIDEVTKTEAEAMLGGPVKEKPKMPPGKQPAGYRYVRSLARAALKASMKKEEVEQTDEAVRIVDVERGLPRKSNVRVRPGSFSASDFRDRLAQAAKERRKITGEPGVKGFNKPIGFSPTKYMDTSYVRAIKKEEIELDEAKKKLKPSYWRAEWRLGTQSEVDKNNKKIYDKLAKTDPAKAKAFQDGLAKLRKEDMDLVEAPKDAADVGEYDYEGDMAKSQLRSIMANSKRMHDMLEENTNLPEWVQSKITLAEDYISTASNYMQGEMNEEVEQVAEKINLAKAKMGDVVKDFYKSKAPQFKGKSMAKRREMAVAAKLGAERDAGMREEVVTEAEGTVAVTPKEKALAAHHGDPKKITYGDVIKARLKSAAAKKMGK